MHVQIVFTSQSTHTSRVALGISSPVWSLRNLTEFMFADNME